MLDLELDEIDRKILEALRKNARTPFTELGRSLGISDATVHVRVKKMVDEAVIKMFTIEVDKEMLGEEVQGFVLLSVAPGSLVDVVKQLIHDQKIHEVYEVHGSHDLMIKIEAADLEKVRDLTLKIRGIKNITSSEVITVFRVWK